MQQNVAVFPDDHLVLMSDNAAYLSAATAVAKGSADGLGDVAGVGSLAAAAGDPVAATQWVSTFACEDLSMGAADEGDQAEGERLVAKAGDAGPFEGLVMAQQADRSLVLGLHFETADQADRNLQTRVDLASGPRAGAGRLVPGPVHDRVRQGRRRGRLITTKPTRRTASALSDLTSGPVLFATC